MSDETSSRYRTVSRVKGTGATYTPPALARFVAERVAEQVAQGPLVGRTVRIVDPAVGEGELLVQLVRSLRARRLVDLEVWGFDVDTAALGVARQRLAALGVCPDGIQAVDFLRRRRRTAGHGPLFARTGPPEFDVVIANPPYVRTQILGRDEARRLAAAHQLTGRVDLYQAFLIVLADWLAPDGVAGVITSNRFLTVQSGEAVRRHLWQSVAVQHVWDLGDTKCFGAAVLPAVTLLRGRSTERAEGRAERSVGMTSIYEVHEQQPVRVVPTVFDAVALEGCVQVEDGRTFSVQQGHVRTEAGGGGVWRLANEAIDRWLEQVARHTWKRFSDIGKIRVGIKTTADAVFIREDWGAATGGVPELLRPLTTHHIGRRYRAHPPQKAVLYTHEVVGGRRRAVVLDDHPISATYLQRHRGRLEGRAYVAKARRKWFEIWVPHHPEDWSRPKLVFRDITDKPQFWVDLDGSVVNGDCYWLACDAVDLIWLAVAVGNSSFIEAFYDRRFNNKLYSGRRRFITQYVQHFPLPDPTRPTSRRIVALAIQAWEGDGEGPDEGLQAELDELVWQAFGFDRTDRAASD